MKNIELNQNEVELILSKIIELKHISMLDFEDDINIEAETRLNIARCIIECESIIELLKQKLN